MQTASGYEVAWEDPGADQYKVWSTDSNGNFISDTPARVGKQPALEALETTFNQDLNGDGVTSRRSSRTVIQTVGTTSLIEVGESISSDL